MPSTARNLCALNTTLLPLSEIPLPAQQAIRLPNGLCVVATTCPQESSPALHLFVASGSRFESHAEQGVSHFLEHVLFRGAGRYASAERINLAFERTGCVPNACTSAEVTEYYARPHASRLEDALRLLAVLIREPHFADLEKERSILLEELAADYNTEGRWIDPMGVAGRSMWGTHPLGFGVGGVPKTIARLDLPALRRHHAHYYLPWRCVLGIASSFPAERVFALAESAFGDWQAPLPQSELLQARASALPAAAPTAHPRLVIVPDDDPRCHVQLSFPCPGYNHPDAPGLTLIERLLDDGPSSLLPWVLRERYALVYDVAVDYFAYWDVARLDISLSVRTEHLRETMQRLLETLGNFCQHGPGYGAWRRALARHRYDLASEGVAAHALLDRYAWPLLYSRVVDARTEAEQAYAFSPQRLRALAQRVLDPQRMYGALVGTLRDADRRWLRTRLRAA